MLDRSTRRRSGASALAGVLAMASLVALALACADDGAPSAGANDAARDDGVLAAATPTAGDASAEDDAATAGQAETEYAGSAACAACHAGVHEAWRPSHHALAERELDGARDSAAFEPARDVAHGTQSTRVRRVEPDTSSSGEPGGEPGEEPGSEARFELVTAGADGETRAFPVDGVFGVDPLVQFLVPTGDGRRQVTELAWDIHAGEWFDVYGEEDRRPGEWGHWTGRGMSWNSQCAACHNTGFQKAWDPSTDGYQWSRAELGVGCEACHGPRAEHARTATGEAPRVGPAEAWTEARRREPGAEPTAAELAALERCGACHARATPMSAEALASEPFDDHYLLSVPDLEDTWYADGQVRDENFEYTAFLQSRMYREGVRCTDCHDPHSGETWLAGDALCLSCHATRPEFEAHDLHAALEADVAVSCVDCHMPVTNYMQRHPRHDHGFHVPDPQLTRELAIPNACDRCHADRGAAWAEAAVDEAYGAERLAERLGATRSRARAVHAARDGDSAAIEPLTGVAREDDSAVWRAGALELLAPFLDDPRTRAAALDGARDPEAQVRARSASLLGPYAGAGDRESARALAELLRDPRRVARVEAARALRSVLDPESPAGAELFAALSHTSDQPSGAAALGAWYFERGRAEDAATQFERALGWEPRAVLLRHALAQCYALLGRGEEAVAQLERAVEDEPDDAELRYALGLALYEVGRLQAAAGRLADATQRDPGHVRAWFNLGLLLPQLGELEDGLAALERAGELEPQSPEAPWARGTVLLEAGRIEEARAEALEALRRDPQHEGARELLRATSGG